jgi:hypothetical protein
MYERANPLHPRHDPNVQPTDLKHAQVPYRKAAVEPFPQGALG